MLATVLHHSAELVAFIAALNLALYRPQIRHLLRLVDAMLVCNGKKTLSNLYRQVEGEPDPKTAADFFCESPWRREDVGQSRKRLMVVKFLELARAPALSPFCCRQEGRSGPSRQAEPAEKRP
jgi:hypothetical protein